jgi:dihydrofolate reductase
MSKLDPLVMVLAMARGGVIGIGNQLPWHVPEDMKHFRAVTLDHALLMGRKTFESIGRPLLRRTNIVVSGSVARFEGCLTAPSFEAALALARAADREPRVIGGRALYAAALPLVTRIYLTEIDRKVDGDVHFDLDRSAFRETERRRGEEKDVSFVTLDRR